MVTLLLIAGVKKIIGPFCHQLFLWDGKHLSRHANKQTPWTFSLVWVLHLLWWHTCTFLVHVALLLFHFQKEYTTLLEHKILQYQKADLKPSNHPHLHNIISQHTWLTFNIRNPSARTPKHQSSVHHLKLKNSLEQVGLPSVRTGPSNTCSPAHLRTIFSTLWFL